MNQILVSEKVYVTPDMKIKKKVFKIEFFLSVFLLCILSSYYIYAEYDRNKDEKISQEILQGITLGQTDTMEAINESNSMKAEQNIIRVVLNAALSDTEEIEVPEETEKEIIVPTEQKSIAKDGTEYFTIGIINIPDINVNYPILSTTSAELLKIAPCKFWGSNPNQVGNLCIVGHNYRNSKFFSKLSKLELGDIIEITDLAGITLKYSVYDKYNVLPEDVNCTSQLTDGKKEVTLITCTNDNKERTVIKATEVK